jgi:hypothetical protein
MKPRALLAASSALLAFGIFCLAAACALSAAQATALRSMVGPDCAVLGAGVAPIPIVGGPLDAIVAVLCAPIADDIITAETKAAAPGAPATQPLFTLAANCKPILIPGDPLKQLACPELHPVVLASSRRLLAAKALRK